MYLCLATLLLRPSGPEDVRAVSLRICMAGMYIFVELCFSFGFQDIQVLLSAQMVDDLVRLLFHSCWHKFACCVCVPSGEFCVAGL